jgi:hypothetical protein
MKERTGVSRLLESLRRTISVIETEVPKLGAPENLAEEVAVLSLQWAAKQLRAITLLFEQGLVLQAEPLVRSLIEMAVNVTWIVKDVGRAERYRDHGLRAYEQWIEAIDRERPGFFPRDLSDATDKMLATSSGRPSLPGIYERAKEANVDAGRLVIKSLSLPYIFSYKRLSATVHADFMLLVAEASQQDGLLVLDAQDAVAGAIALLAGAGVTVGLETAFDSVLLELRRAFEESKPE